MRAGPRSGFGSVAAISAAPIDRLPEPMQREAVLLLAEGGCDAGTIVKATGLEPLVLRRLLTEKSTFRHATEIVPKRWEPEE